MQADKIILMQHDAGGEGSRGGKIIGHTSSGKPIYASKKLMSIKKELERASQQHQEFKASGADEGMIRHAQSRVRALIQRHNSQVDKDKRMAEVKGMF